MKILAIAFATFESFLRNRILLFFFVIFLGIVLLMMSPLLAIKAANAARHGQGEQGYILELVSVVIYMVSGFGSLLAAWAATEALAGEMRSGTVLAVMARPLWRWQFLTGKYLGVQMVLFSYILLMLGLSHILAWIGGARVPAASWILILYPLVRYALYSAIGLLLATFFGQIVSLSLVFLLSILISLSPMSHHLQGGLFSKLFTLLHFILPSTEILSEERFLTITHASLRQTGWMEHCLTLAYGLDYALVCLVLAIWSFRYRSLVCD